MADGIRWRLVHMPTHSLPPIDPRRAVVRVAISFAGGLAAFGVAVLQIRPTGAAFIAWDVFGLVLLVLSWAGIVRADAMDTRLRASSEDPGRTLVYVIIVLASAVSLLGTTLLVRIPGDIPPTYFDFAYFAFTIGMCFQVSDLCVTSHQIRRTVLLHAVISFAYNSIVLAFVLNLVFSAG